MPIAWVQIDDGAGGWQVVPMAMTQATGTTTSSTVWFTNAATTSTCSNTIWLGNAATTSSSGDWVILNMGTESGTGTYWQQVNAQQQVMQAMLAQQCAGQLNNNYIAQASAESAEQRAAREQRQRDTEAAKRRREHERRAAEEKARELLLSHLTPEQREHVTRHGWFVVEGGRSRKRYRIRTGSGAYAGNIDELDADGNVVATLCCHASSEIPPGDQHLTQKLMLESDEEHFIARANRRRVGV